MRHGRILGALALSVTVGACAQVPGFLQSPGDGSGAPAGSAGAPPPPEEIAAIVAAPPPPRAARTADQFDTTSAEQKAAASAAPAAGEERLGETVASLGDPMEAGLWIKTPLVSSQRAGRVEYPATGRGAVVELRPTGTSDGGSQISLAAMRLLGVPLTDLPTLVVYGK